MLESLIGAVLGPFGALAILLLILYGAYRFSVDKGFPLMTKYVDNVDDSFKALLVEHKADREAFMKAITALTTRQDKLEESISDVKDDVSKLLDRDTKDK